MSKTSGIKEAYDIIADLIQCAEVGRYDGKLISAAKDWMSQNPLLKGPTEVKIGGCYWTKDGNPVIVWGISQDDGCYCNDLKYHCASTLRDRNE